MEERSDMRDKSDKRTSPIEATPAESPLRLSRREPTERERREGELRLLADIFSCSRKGAISREDLPLPSLSSDIIPDYDDDEEGDDPLEGLEDQAWETDDPWDLPSPLPLPPVASVLPSMAPNLVEVAGLKKGYIKGKKLIPVLQGIDLAVQQGEFLAIVGQSGSGKSTLLHLMGTLDVPDSGSIHFDGQRIDQLPSAKRDFIRNHYVGMIFQFYHLIPEMTTLENVLAPLMIRDSIFGYLRHRREYRRRATELLDLVRLSHRLKHRPSELSGGEMQRVSVARALIAQPRILLADEPTGNLDSKTSTEIIRLLRQLNREQNLTVVMVTHDLPEAENADRIVRLVDGLVSGTTGRKENAVKEK